VVALQDGDVSVQEVEEEGVTGTVKKNCVMCQREVQKQELKHR